MELFRWERIARKACTYNETDLPVSAPQAVPLQVHMYLSTKFHVTHCYLQYNLYSEITQGK